MPSRLSEIKSRIASACVASHRNANSVCLIAVSKTQPFEKIKALYAEGQRDFGENYVQELVEKAAEAEAAGLKDIRWHFIGHLQRNKVKGLVSVVHAIHSVDSLALASEIGKRAMSLGRMIPVFLQVNIDGEASKSGVSPGEVPALLNSLHEIKGVNLDGLMAIPEPEQARTGAPFRRLKALATPQMALSMGMSEDFELAIREGATHIRVGTALFGARTT